MRKLYWLGLFAVTINAICFSNNLADSIEQLPPKEEITLVEKPAPITHYDPTQLIIKKENSSAANTDRSKRDYITTMSKSQNNVSSGISYKNNENIAIVCYKSGTCLVQDTRNIKVQSGINEIEFDNLYPGLIPESINFRTPKKGKITALNYVFNSKNFSKQNLLYHSIGDDVFYSIAGDSKPEKGKLIGIAEEYNKKFAIIIGNGRCNVIPVDSCIAFNEGLIHKIGNNSLNVTFESEEQEDLNVEISYLTSGISWKHFCLIEVFDKLDRVDIFSQALLQNNTDYDLDNVFITFDSSSPNILKSNPITKSVDLKGNNQNTSNYRRNITVKKRSETMCTLTAAKSLKPSLEYIIKIPLKFIDNSLSKEIELPVNNLLIISNTKELGIDADFNDSDAIIFRRKNNEKTFLGRQILSSLKKGDDFVFEIGTASEILASVQQVDFKKLSEKNAEYGVRVSTKNNKQNDISIIVALDIDGPWNITKRNFEMQKSDKPIWKLDLKAGETKESHFRIKVGI